MTSTGHGSEEARQAEDIRRVFDAIPTLAWSARSDGAADFFNRRWLDYTGLSVEQARDWGWSVAVHPDDLDGLADYWRSILASHEPGEREARLRRFDGVYRWFLFRATPSFDNDGAVVKWFGTNTDIEDRKRAESLLAGQNLVLEMTAKGNSLEAILEALCRVVEQSATGCCCSFMLFDSSGSTVQQVVAPSLPSSYNDRFPGAPVDREDGPFIKAARRKTQVIVSDVASDSRWDRYGWRTAALTHGLEACWSTAILTSNDLVLGAFAIYWREPRGPSKHDEQLIEQITHLAAVAIERQRSQAALEESEQSLRLIVDSIPGFVSTANAEGELELVNRQVLDYFGKTAEEMKGWSTSDNIHPDDRPRMIEAYRRAIETGQPLDVENRSRRADGVYRWFHVRGRPQRDAEGRIARWYHLVTDIDERKKAEEEVRRSEAYLTEAQHLSRTGSFGCKVPSGEMIWSAETFRIFGYDRATASSVEAILQRVHPEDRVMVREHIARATGEGKDCDLEYRLLLPGDSLKHVHVVAHAVNDGAGGCELLGAVMDVTEQRQARAELERAFEEIERLKDRLHDENVALREQIDQGFMFEEIVGSASALKTVLSGIVKVAPTDSTVLITGETGTGKELIARAIHKRSRRAGQAFLSVNCASIPSTLIASELFGHEKGAFTGALQRRQGRFELAHSGTIFLDEIGELPAETQIALLRVLQERQFERVGGSRAIATDVRIIAATNRDLAAAIASGTFRADLFYRLNVFPIHVPPLRQRKEDIPMLVEYFVKRYAAKARKQISKIDRHTLELCQAYHWPGNIRELQNIVERSVILCNGDTFSVERAWLSSQAVGRPEPGALASTLQSVEKEIIEKALADSNGKVAGPHGAAARLGIPRTTLDARIKQLNIKRSIIR
jgi:PAS domain S-box-containing protein